MLHFTKPVSSRKKGRPGRPGVAHDFSSPWTSLFTFARLLILIMSVAMPTFILVLMPTLVAVPTLILVFVPALVAPLVTVAVRLG